MNFTPEEVKKWKDLNQGLKMEDALLPIFENKFGKLIKTKQYHVFDYINDKYILELKTRNIKFGQYQSLMFGKNKLDKAKETKDKDFYIFWKLQDGLYYWKYKEGEYKVAKGGRKDRGKDEINDLCFIDNEYIKNYNDLVID
tara:strand:- start:239 stop:664 length:426 start_codon:yes stop_codon:yes gene_type:complete